MKKRWIRVTRQKPCPICARPDWCSVSADGVTVVCMRTESNKPCKSGGWYHKLSEPIPYNPPPRPKQKPVARVDFTALACQCEQAIGDMTAFAQLLGVSVRSLERLQVGFLAGQGHTFPMRDGRDHIIGIHVRGVKAKWSIPSSKNGLFIPEGVGRDYPCRLLICEGATDCAALLDLGYAACGRPSCSAGTEYIVDLLKAPRREVVIVADHDEAHYRPDGSVYYPGQEGAVRLAKVIRPLVKTLKVIKPPNHKDVRAWYNAGATRDVVETVIRNTRFQ